MSREQTASIPKPATALASQEKDPEHKAGGLAFWQFLVLTVPAVLAAYLIYLYAVDIPWGDQWYAESMLFEKMATHTLGISDFFRLHNEHRIFFPRLIMFGLGVLTHWDTRAESLMIWLLMGACVFSICYLAKRNNNGGMRGAFSQLLAANLLLFTPLQYENLLWGFQIGFLLPIAAMAACVCLTASSRPPVTFVAAAILCTISTFSIASGFICWILVLPLVAATGGDAFRQLGRWWAMFLGLFLLEEVLYFTGYVKPTVHPSLLECFIHPLRALGYFLAYMGGGFGGGMIFHTAATAIICGAILMALFSWCLVVLWHRKDERPLLSELFPWLILSTYGICNGLITTVGRSGFGIDQALCSRYVSFSVFLPIGLVFIIPRLLGRMEEDPRSGVKPAVLRWMFGLFTLALILVFILGFSRSIRKWEGFQHEFLTAKAVVETINLVDEPAMVLASTGQAAAPLRKSANLLEELDYLRPRLLRSKAIRGIGDPESKGDIRFGAIQRFGETVSGQLAVLGWAFLPAKHRPADAVLLTVDDPSGKPVIFALASVQGATQEIATQTEDPAYARCGFSKGIPPARRPPAGSTLKAWAFDAEENHAFRIQGEGRAQ